MKKQLQKFFAKKKNNKGFTLIELIIVIAILAILIGIVGMASIRYVEKSRKSADEQTLDSVANAAQAVIIDPDNGITVTSGSTIEVTSAGGVTASNGIASSKSVNVSQEIRDSLAKTPALKSQTYKNGATATITVTTNNDGSIKDIKFGGWTAKGATPAPAGS